MSYELLRRFLAADPFEPVLVALRDGRLFRIERRSDIEMACDRPVVILCGQAVAIADVAAIGPIARSGLRPTTAGRPFPLTRHLCWAPAELNRPVPGERYLVAYRVMDARRGWDYSVVTALADGRLECEGRAWIWGWSDVDWYCATSELSPTRGAGE